LSVEEWTMIFDKDTNLEVKVGGAKVPIADVFEFTVDVDSTSPTCARWCWSTSRGPTARR